MIFTHMLLVMTYARGATLCATALQPILLVDVVASRGGLIQPDQPAFLSLTAG
jgi:hypothetical protein